MGMSKKNRIYLSSTILLCSLFFHSCISDDIGQLRGQIDGGLEQISLTKPGLHYKFAEPELFIIPVDQNGRFEIDLIIEEATVYFLRLFDVDYPILLEPGKRTTVTIPSGRYPFDVSVRGSSRELNQQYQLYLSQITNLERHSRSERRNFLTGKPNDYVNMMRLRVDLAKEFLAGTPFEKMVLRNNGEFIVAKLEEIRIRKHEKEFPLEFSRNQLLNYALNSGFFSYASLTAQRAGIRDFADAWSKTFHIKYKTEARIGRSLMEYDWKRKSFDELTKVKLALLDIIQDEDAYNHALMYLLAEIIAEGPFQEAYPHYRTLSKKLEHDETYFSFLTALYDDIKQVQPGNMAPDFELKDQFGEVHSLDSFRGSYILLDFWASWCIPCLEEFPYMQRLHKKYSKNNLVIVSISLDENEYAWEQTLERYDLPWIQLYAGEGFSQKMFQEYRAGGIPFYVLIDRNGEIKRLNDIRPSFNFDDIFEDILYLEQYYALRGLRTN